MKKLFLKLHLEKYFNNNGLSFNENRSSGDFDSWGKTFPAEELPESNSTFISNEIEFIFPDKTEVFNNMTLASQSVDFIEGDYCKLHLLITSENGSYKEKIKLLYHSGIIEEELFIEDFFFFGKTSVNQIGIKCTHYHEPDGDRCYYSDINESGDKWKVIPVIWHLIVPLDKNMMLGGITFYCNPCIHLFALTLEK